MQSPSITGLRNPLRNALLRAWRVNALLVILGLAMGALSLATLAGIFLDPAVITGAPAWVKPSKFALSFTIYAFTLVWLLGYLPGRRRLVRVVAVVTTVTALVEIGAITFQAWRGKTSHFNQESLFDGMLFTFMGVAIVALYLAAIATAFALGRARIRDRAFASAVRLGMVVSILGMGQAGLMLPPTAEQAAEAAVTGERTTRNGGHTVGAVDGGPGIPFLGWSTEAGDLRVGHFVGMHAIQVLPMVGWLLARRRLLGESQRLSLVRIAAGAYLAIVVTVTWQALRGQSVVAPDGLTIGAFVLIVASSAALAVARLRGNPVRAAGIAGEAA